MNRRKLILSVVLSAGLILAFSLPALSNTPSAIGPKQVAAPPSEFVTGKLNLPDPAQAGIRSQWAMLPVKLQPAADGSWTWTQAVPIDNAQDFALLILSPDRQAWDVRVETPDRVELNLKDADRLAGIDHAVGQLGEGAAQYPGDVYTFSGYAPGEWTVRVSSATAPTNKAAPSGYLLLADRQSPYRLFTQLSSYDLLAGREVGLVTTVYADQAKSEGSVPTALRDVKVEAEMQVHFPDGQEFTTKMVDDGQHADGKAGDGVFGGFVKAPAAGEYTAQVVVRGQTPTGQSFLRTSEHVFPVIDAGLTLQSVATVEVQDASTLRIPLQGVITGQLPEQLLVAAEVWGHDAQGAAVPVTWISGMVTPQTSPDGGVTLPLNLDTRWIALAKASAPFELRQVRVQDVNTHIPIARLETAALKVSSLPKLARSVVTGATPDMLMGARPAATLTDMKTEPSAYVGGHKLMLVHGYCSGGNPWPTADFTNYAVFVDANQNRSHDQFARLIRDYGVQFDSFGAVGHSQGGDALLQLYTYYWSGLDYSSGSRLIQSVGTPYQGTALAGNLALLGQIFGVGCGSNWDLTYDGAALWLSGIPQWARDRVYYWTTSFTDVWWRYDYCNIASDVLLSDPDDGVIERWAGQLAGAHNMGHKTGWCHTTGMRDTAQSLDHGRNAEMNTYGNR